MKKWLYFLFKNFFGIIWEYFTKLIRYGKNPAKYNIDKRYNMVKRRLSGVCRDVHCNFFIEGLENIPDEVSVFYPNHLSSFDPVVFFPILDRPTAFVAKTEIKKWPIVSHYFKVLGGEFLDRKDLKQSLKVMMNVQADLTKNKEKNWVIFAEGTRNKDTSMLVKEMHHGSFRPAMKSGVPIVPVVLFGTQRVLTTKYSLKNYPIHIKFLKPIMPSDYAKLDTKTVAKMVKEMIEKELYFNIREKDIIEMKKVDKTFYPHLLK